MCSQDGGAVRSSYCKSFLRFRCKRRRRGNSHPREGWHPAKRDDEVVTIRCEHSPSTFSPARRQEPYPAGLRPAPLPRRGICRCPTFFTVKQRNWIELRPVKSSSGAASSATPIRSRRSANSISSAQLVLGIESSVSCRVSGSASIPDGVAEWSDPIRSHAAQAAGGAPPSTAPSSPVSSRMVEFSSRGARDANAISQILPCLPPRIFQSAGLENTGRHPRLR